MTSLTELASGFSLNSLRTTGEYAIPAPANAPVGVNHCFVTVKSHNLASVRRVAQTLYDAETGGAYYRAFGSSGWTEWTEMGGGGGGDAGTLSLTDGEPDSGDGVDGDIRLDWNDGAVYRKENDLWSAVGNFLYSQDDAFWTTVVKSTNTTRNNTDVSVADPELKFPIEADRAYLFSFRIWYETGSTPDFKFSLAGPASPDKIVLSRQYLAPNTSAWGGIGTYTSYAGPATLINGTGGTQGIIELSGIIENGPNAGDVEFLWAQNTATLADTTVLRGSYVEYKDHYDC